MSQTTEHGERIADQIQGEDAYGYSGDLTTADVWNILDNLHRHFMEQKHESMLTLLSNWMRNLEYIDTDLPD